MEKLIIGVVAAIIGAMFIGVIAIIGTVIGACCGWIVGLVFDGTSARLLTALGIEHLQMWEIGAALGFVGAFFRSGSS